jgi:lipopolysaccharide assembly protein A
MQILRTLAWIIATAALVAFVAMNWETAPVRFWPLQSGEYLRFDWPVGFTAIVFFLLGLVPMWLVHRAAKWRMARRIQGLEASVRAATPTVTATTPLPATPVAAGDDVAHQPPLTPSPPPLP